MQQRAVENCNEDYDLLLERNKSLLDEHDDFCYQCEDLRAKLLEVRSKAKKHIADLEVKVKFAEAHSANVVALLYPVLRPNRVLIVCAPMNQVYIHTV
jgi:hypothetical protein